MGIVVTKFSSVSVTAPPGDWILISHMHTTTQGTWYMKVWLDHMVSDSKNPIKGPKVYNFHCYLRDESKHQIYTSVVFKYQKDCQPIYKLINGSCKDKPLYIISPNFEEQELKDQTIYVCKFRLLLDQHTEITKAYEICE